MADNAPMNAHALRAMATDLSLSWRTATGYQAFLWWSGVALVVAGLACAVAWLVDGAPSLAGSVSWRKPIEFGVSLGLTGMFLAWILRWLPRSARIGWSVAVTYSVTAVAEWALITVQKVRGVPSHFNNSTDVDSVVFTGMGVMIGGVMLSILALAIWAWRRPVAGTDRPMVGAVRTGLGFLLLGQLLGALLLLNGFGVVDDAVLATFDRAGILGAAGDMKLPHAIAIHGLQLIPVLGWLLSLGARAEPRRAQLVALGSLGFGVLLTASVVQMAAGRAPLDVDLLAAALAVFGAVALGAAYVAALITLFRRPVAARAAGIA
jgi:hypothetical protein